LLKEYHLVTITITVVLLIGILHTLTHNILILTTTDSINSCLKKSTKNTFLSHELNILDISSKKLFLFSSSRVDQIHLANWAMTINNLQKKGNMPTARASYLYTHILFLDPMW